MFALDGGDVYISRGDDASFDIVFTGLDNQSDPNVVYYRVNEIPADGTKIRFSVKADTGRLKSVIQKDLEVRNGFVTIPLDSIDTHGLPFGDYAWDVRLFHDTSNGHDLNTPLLPHGFHVIGVVGNE